MQHHKHIAQLLGKEYFREKSALFNAFLECLTPQKACEQLWIFWELDYLTKLPLLRKIGNDMAMKHLDCHNELISDLLKALDETTGRGKRRSLAALGYFFNLTTEKNRINILEALLLSDSVILHRRAKKLLRTAWQPNYETIVLEAWTRHQTPDIAEIVIIHLDSSFLKDNFIVLERLVAYSWAFTRLYLRTGADYPKILSRLQAIDGITYAYVLVKLKQRLSVKKALSLFEENKYDDRLGLLIWCLGKMKLRSVLIDIEEHLEASPFRLGPCSECKSGYLFSQGPYIDKSKTTELGLPKQFRVFRCSDCSIIWGLFKGRFEVLFE